MSTVANAVRGLCVSVVLAALGVHAASAQNLIVKGATTGEGNANFLANVAVGTAATPNVKLSVNGGGANIYFTDFWVENNAHIQGSETLTQGGRARLRLGSVSGYAGLYAEPSSTGIANDLSLGASSGLVRIGCDTCGQSLRVFGPVTQSLPDLPSRAPIHTLTFTGWGGGSSPYIEAKIDSSYVGVSVF